MRRALVILALLLPWKRKWRCFHCDEVFTDEAEASDHFGEYGPCAHDEPLCVSPLRTDEKLRLKELVEARNYAVEMQRGAQRADELEGDIESFYRDMRRYFGDDCTSIWLAGDRYNNALFELSQLRKKDEAMPCEP